MLIFVTGFSRGSLGPVWYEGRATEVVVRGRKVELMTAQDTPPGIPRHGMIRLQTRLPTLAGEAPDVN